jgi:hypothetical protein
VSDPDGAVEAPVDDLERRLVRLLGTVVRLRGTEDRLRELVAASLSLGAAPDADAVLLQAVDRARALLAARSAVLRLRGDGWSAPVRSGPEGADGGEALLDAIAGSSAPVRAPGLLGTALRVEGAAVGAIVLLAPLAAAPAVGFDDEDAQVLATFAAAVGGALAAAWRRRALEADAARADAVAGALARLAATVGLLERSPVPAVPRDGRGPDVDAAVAELERAVGRVRGLADELARSA